MGLERNDRVHASIGTVVCCNLFMKVEAVAGPGVDDGSISNRLRRMLYRALLEECY